MAETHIIRRIHTQEASHVLALDIVISFQDKYEILSHVKRLISLLFPRFYM